MRVKKRVAEIKEVKFFLPMIPPNATQQTHKVKVVNNKPIVYEPDELKNARMKIRSHLAGYVPAESLTGPVMLFVAWLWPTGKNHKSCEYKITKPDTDNLQKMLKDEMERLGFWENDAQVCVEHVEKRYDDPPGIWIHAQELKE